MGKKSPFIVPLFIPHLGCPHRCIFCNQQAITGRSENAGKKPQLLSEEIARWLARKQTGRPAQVAFYGGSFTALPLRRQIDMLQTVRPFLRDGRVESIRLSTRPDAVSEEICRMLWEQGVRTVELGVQSMDDKVLAAAQRGHTRGHTEEAMALLRSCGFAIGGQLMIGLPADSSGSAQRSAKVLAECKPDFVRIYPTLVVRDSPLAALYRQGRYRPLSLSRSVVLAERLKEIFDSHDIPVIRMGLQHSEGLLSHIVSGPHHPAFGELVLSRQYFKRLRKLLFSRQQGSSHQLEVAARDQSILRGPANANWLHLLRRGHLEGVRVVFSPDLARNAMKLRRIAG